MFRYVLVYNKSVMAFTNDANVARNWVRDGGEVQGFLPAVA